MDSGRKRKQSGTPTRVQSKSETSRKRKQPGSIEAEPQPLVKKQRNARPQPKKKGATKRKKAAPVLHDEASLNPHTWHDRLQCKTELKPYQQYAIERTRDDFDGRVLSVCDTGLGKTLQSVVSMFSYFHNYCSHMRKSFLTLLATCGTGLEQHLSLCNLVFQYVSDACKRDEWPSSPLVFITVTNTVVRQVRDQIVEHTDIPTEAIRLWEPKLFDKSTRLRKKKGKDVRTEGTHIPADKTRKGVSFRPEIVAAPPGGPVVTEGHPVEETAARVDPAWFANHAYSPWIEVMTHAIARKHAAWIHARAGKCIVLDESHKIKIGSSKTTQVIKPLVRRAARAILCTATTHDRPIHLYDQVDALRPGLLPPRRAYIYDMCGGVEVRGHDGRVHLKETGCTKDKRKLLAFGNKLQKTCMLRIRKTDKDQWRPRQPWSAAYPIVAPADAEARQRLRATRESRAVQEARRDPRSQAFWDPATAPRAPTSASVSSAGSSAPRVEFIRVLLHVEPPPRAVADLWNTYRQLRRLLPVWPLPFLQDVARRAYDPLQERKRLREELSDRMAHEAPKTVAAVAAAAAERKPTQLEKASLQAGLAARQEFVRSFLADTILPHTANKVVFFGHRLELTDHLVRVAQPLCEAAGVGWIRFDGTVSDGLRAENVARFRDDPACRVAFVGIESGGTGVEWVAANHAVLVEKPWNWTTFDQLIGRVAYRLSQKKNVEIRMLELHDSYDTIKWRVIQSKGKNVALISNGAELAFDFSTRVAPPPFPGLARV